MYAKSCIHTYVPIHIHIQSSICLQIHTYIHKLNMHVCIYKFTYLLYNAEVGGYYGFFTTLLLLLSFTTLLLLLSFTTLLLLLLITLLLQVSFTTLLLSFTTLLLSFTTLLLSTSFYAEVGGYCGLFYAFMCVCVCL